MSRRDDAHDRGIESEVRPLFANLVPPVLGLVGIGVLVCAAWALRLCPSWTDHSASVRLAAPNWPFVVVVFVWYHATSTRPPEPAVIHGNVFVPDPLIRFGLDHFTFDGSAPAGASERTT